MYKNLLGFILSLVCIVSIATAGVEIKSPGGGGGAAGGGFLAYSTYDPTGISDDAFDYQNHFGNISTTEGHFSIEVNSPLGNFTAINASTGTEAVPGVQVGTTQTGLNGATAYALGISVDGKIGGLVELNGTTLYGYLAGDSITNHTNADRNTAIGAEALRDNTTGDQNIAIGPQALRDSINEAYNIAIGSQALRVANGAGSNVAIGANSMVSCTTCGLNVAIGHQALLGATAATSNTAIGASAMKGVVTGTQNIGIGYEVMSGAITGTGNVGVGVSVLDALTSGTYNIALGSTALSLEQTGDYNVVLGYQAGKNQNGQSDNVLVGVNSGYNAGIGSENVMLGKLAGFANQGSRNVMIGTNAGYTGFTGDDQLIISNADDATPLIHGDFATEEITINGSLAVTVEMIIPNGADPAATCTVGSIYLDTDETKDTNCTTTADNSLCLCTATNTWTVLENN